MKFYGDASATYDPRWMRASVEVAMRDSTPATRVERCRDALIAAGQIEQALADSMEADHAELLVASSVLTDCCADALAAAHDPALWAAFTMPALPTLWQSADTLRVTHPEGFLFYAIYPEVYQRLGARLAAEQPATIAVVIGLRSIGTSLSAAFAAGVRSRGLAVARYTVRPQGDPFDRHTVPADREAMAWRAAALRGARFFIVDEGPGLSGSSLASVVTALMQLGIDAERISMICAYTPGELPMGSPAVRAIWADTCWRTIEDDERRFWEADLPQMLARPLGRNVRTVRDLSWGTWAGSAGPVALPGAERRKLLLMADGEWLLAKFIGFGTTGKRKAELARDLAIHGFTPPVAGYHHGMLVQRWIGDPDRPASEPEAGPPPEFVARYYAHLRLHHLAEQDAMLDETAATADQIAESWFGAAALGSAVRLLNDQVRASIQPLQGDQRPERAEWVQGGGQWWKTDVADHFLDHSWARYQDIAFDLAGALSLHLIPPAEQVAFVAAYRQLSGDAAIEQRLPFYRAVFAAHRLAALDTAYHAAPEWDRQAIGIERRLVGDLLGAALMKGNETASCAL